jgi:hypothetical protein
MDKQNLVCIHNGALLSYKEERNYEICRKMNGTGEHHIELNKQSSKNQVSHVFAHF